MWAIHVFIASIPLITALTFSNGTDFFHEELWDNQWLELNGMMRYKCLPRSTDLTRIWYFEERYVGFAKGFLQITLITLTPVDLRTGRMGASNSSICPDRVPE
ncbi:hypothetical protein RB195_002003 [Necator americanus]|uniref:Secreted protein n=1 Tax=Necator americanus TaxID=51031 RepID=A0ABR1DGX6_NECAM